MVEFEILLLLLYKDFRIIYGPGLFKDNQSQQNNDISWM